MSNWPKQRVDELLTCSVCGGRRQLDGSRVWRDGEERHTFRCPSCGHTHSYKNEELPPFMVGGTWGKHQIPSVKRHCVSCGCELAISKRTKDFADGCLIICMECVKITKNTVVTVHPETVKEVREFLELEKHR